MHINSKESKHSSGIIPDLCYTESLSGECRWKFQLCQKQRLFCPCFQRQHKRKSEKLNFSSLQENYCGVMLSFMVFVSVFPFHRLQAKEKVEKLSRLGTCGSLQPFDPFYSSSHPNSWFNTGSLPGVSGYSTSWVFCPHLCSFQASSSRERSVPFTHPWQQKDKSVQNTAVSSFFLPTTTNWGTVIFSKEMTSSYVCF